MTQTLILTGDVNFLNVSDPTVPFAKVSEVLGRPTWFSVSGVLPRRSASGLLFRKGRVLCGSQVGEALKLGNFTAVGWPTM